MSPARLGRISSNRKKQRDETGERVHRETREVTRLVGELESCQLTGISATSESGPAELPVIEITLSRTVISNTLSCRWIREMVKEGQSLGRWGSSAKPSAVGRKPRK